jgi:hypothetical protein
MKGVRCPKLPPPTFGHLMQFGFVQPLQFAAVTRAQYSLLWVLRIGSNLDTGSKCGSWRATLAQPFG